MAGTSTVLVFDFDKTIIDCDSDNWVADSLGATAFFDQILQTLPWNSAMDKLMSELHLQGRSMEEIADVLRQAPIHPSTISAIRSARALGCELRIVSDANLFFIETILKHHGLTACFSEINTNPSYVDDEGRLRIFPYHDFTTSPHGCSLCPPNMCKGLIMERIQASAVTEGKKSFIYLGDGKGDYCPSLKLSEEDFVMPRKDYPLWELICSNAQELKAEVCQWRDGEELERVLLQLIDKSIPDTERGNAAPQLLSSDCKFQNIPLSAQEGLPHALPVHQY